MARAGWPGESPSCKGLAATGLAGARRRQPRPSPLIPVLAVLNPRWRCPGFGLMAAGQPQPPPLHRKQVRSLRSSAGRPGHAPGLGSPAAAFCRKLPTVGHNEVFPQPVVEGSDLLGSRRLVKCFNQSRNLEVGHLTIGTIRRRYNLDMREADLGRPERRVEIGKPRNISQEITAIQNRIIFDLSDYIVAQAGRFFLGGIPSERKALC
jgi:hypothetical protein